MLGGSIFGSVIIQASRCICLLCFCLLFQTPFQRQRSVDWLGEAIRRADHLCRLRRRHFFLLLSPFFRAALCSADACSFPAVLRGRGRIYLCLAHQTSRWRQRNLLSFFLL